MNAAQASIVMGQLHSAIEEYRHDNAVTGGNDAPTSLPGFTCMGTGCMAAVYAPEEYPDFVIKVGFKKEDSGAAYAAWCRWYAGTPHVPDIILIRRFERVYMVAMPLYHSTEFEYSTGLSDAIDSYVKDPSESADLWDYWDGGEVPGSFMTTLKLIHEFFVGVASFDLHEDNLMQDAAGNFIITDPVSYTRGTYNNRKDGACGML